MGKVKVCGCQLHWDHHFVPLKCCHTERSSLILCTRDRGLSPPQLKSSHQMASAAIRKRKWHCHCSLARASFTSSHPSCLSRSPWFFITVLPCGDVSLLSMVSYQHQSEIGVRRLSGHLPSSHVLSSLDHKARKAAESGRPVGPGQWSAFGHTLSLQGE